MIIPVMILQSLRDISVSSLLRYFKDLDNETKPSSSISMLTDGSVALIVRNIYCNSVILLQISLKLVVTPGDWLSVLDALQLKRRIQRDT